MGHAHHDHPHAETAAPTSGRVLWLGLLITAGFALVEALAGWWSSSLALMGDAGHMLTDASALGIGALAARFSRIGPNRRYSYGLKRAELVGALINVLFMYAVVGLIAVAALRRLNDPVAVDAITVVGIGLLGLLVNVIVAWLLHRGEQTLNTRGAMLHVMGDLLGSLAAVVAGLVILGTNWMPIDPILSLLVCALIVVSSTRLLLSALNVVMAAVPDGLDLDDITQAMEACDPAVHNVHHVHVWALSSSTTALSAHVEVDDLTRWPAIQTAIASCLERRFSIDHPTLQPELRSASAVCRPC